MLSMFQYIIYIPDNESPRFEFCPSNQTDFAEPRQDTAVVAWSNPIATDNSDKEPFITCNPKSGTRFLIGQRNVHCTAEDKSGNKAECIFYVDIKGKLLRVLMHVFNMRVNLS